MKRANDLTTVPGAEPGPGKARNKPGLWPSQTGGWGCEYKPEWPGLWVNTCAYDKEHVSAPKKISRTAWQWKEGVSQSAGWGEREGIPAAEQGVASRLTAQQPEVGGRNGHGREQAWKDRPDQFRKRFC